MKIELEKRLIQFIRLGGKITPAQIRRLKQLRSEVEIKAAIDYYSMKIKELEKEKLNELK